MKKAFASDAGPRNRSRELLEELLDKGGVRIGGTAPWDIQVHNEQFYRRVAGDGRLGLGEMYMQGWWDCDALDQLVTRMAWHVGTPFTLQQRIKFVASAFVDKLVNFQSRKRAPTVARVHYDLSTELFESFLDPYMQYTCAFFDEGDDLDRAQVRKMELVAHKLHLEPRDRVLDIGCGWGGFAKFMAERYGCRVTGVNISAAQIRHGRTLCSGLPITLLHQDYRDIEGNFSKVAAVGIIEHVGAHNYREFFEIVNRVLEDDGIFLLHGIGVDERQRAPDPWLDKYLFRNSHIPTLSELTRATQGLFMVEDLHNIGPHYDTTLMQWCQRFESNWHRLRCNYDECFRRMWRYYLLTCAGYFRSRCTQLWQLVLTKPGRSQPSSRPQG